LPSLRRLKRVLRDHRRFLILCHPNADPDAVCSAIVLRNLIRRLRRGAEVEMAAPEGLSSISKGIAAKFGQEFSEEPDLSGAESFFALDLSSLSQLGAWGEAILGSRRPLILMDHHAPDAQTKGGAYMAIIDESATSTCEIVYRVMRGLGAKPSRRDLELLFIGIAHETRSFSIATREAFLIASEAVRAGSKPFELFQLIRPQMDRSERIARLKGSQRMELRTHGDWIIAISRVDSFQASVARALINLGADLAIVGGGEGGGEGEPTIHRCLLEGNRDPPGEGRRPADREGIQRDRRRPQHCCRDQQPRPPGGADERVLRGHLGPLEAVRGGGGEGGRLG
jgi:phosphoesterase RecJ-like protein